MKKRDTDFSHAGYFCGRRWRQAYWWPLYKGVEYLSGVHGPLHMKVAPSACSRANCSYRAAIYFCNDVSH